MCAQHAPRPLALPLSRSLARRRIVIIIAAPYAPRIAARRHRSPSLLVSRRPRVFRHGPKPCAVDEDAEFPVPELAQQVVQAQHHHVHQHVVVHHFRAGHDAHQRQHHAGVHSRRLRL